MNCDLEGDLAGCAKMCAFVERLRAAPQARVGCDFTERVLSAVKDGVAEPPRKGAFAEFVVRTVFSAAACLAMCMVVHSIFDSAASGSNADSVSRLVACQRDDGTFSSSSAAQYMQAFAVVALAKDASAHAAALNAAVGAITRSQNAAGGWANSEISTRNVEALRVAAGVGVAGAMRAYRRGLRYLRVNGIDAMTGSDFARAAKDAVGRANWPDEGLARTAGVCGMLM